MLRCERRPWAWCVLRPYYPEEYRHNVERVERFLAGNRREFVDELTGEMRDAATELDFERAGRIRRLHRPQSIRFQINLLRFRRNNADVVGISVRDHRGRPCVHGAGSRVSQTATSSCSIVGRDVPDECTPYLLRYYDATTSIPHEVIVERELEKMHRRWKHGLRTNSTPPMAQRFVLLCPNVAKSETCSTWHAENAQHTLMLPRCVRTTRINAQ